MVYRFPEWQKYLSSQGVEIIGRRGEIADKPVDLMQLLHLKIFILGLKTNVLAQFKQCNSKIYQVFSRTICFSRTKCNNGQWCWKIICACKNFCVAQFKTDYVLASNHQQQKKKKNQQLSIKLIPTTFYSDKLFSVIHSSTKHDVLSLLLIQSFHATDCPTVYYWFV